MLLAIQMVEGYLFPQMEINSENVMKMAGTDARSGVDVAPHLILENEW